MSKNIKISDEIKEKIINLYQTGIPISKVAIEVGVSVSGARKIIINAGIPIRPNGTDQDRVQQVLQLFQNGVTTREISKKLSIGRGTITAILKDNNLGGHFRKYKINDNFLDEINSEEQAYFLGWMSVAGSLYGRASSIAIQIKESRSHLLEIIATWFSEDKIITYGKYNDSDGRYASFCIYASNTKAKLIDLGFLEKKDIKFPEWLAPELHRHFIRGIVDAGGNVNVIDYAIQTNFKTSSHIIEKVLSIITNELNVTGKIIQKRANGLHFLEIDGIENNLKFFEYIYNNISIGHTKNLETARSYVPRPPRESKLGEKFTEEERQQIIKLREEEGLDLRTIAKIVKADRWTVTAFLKKNNISTDRIIPKQEKVHNKCCAKCNITKDISEFREYQYKDRIYYGNCWDCDLKDSRDYYKINQEKILEKCKIEYWKNRDKYLLDNKIWRENNKEYLREYHLKNIERRRLTFNAWARHKRKTNPAYKLREIVSGQISSALKKNDSSKNNESCLKYLPYSIQELRQHLESQFEPWMTWENHGKYEIDKWDDNDSSTWKWQIDHIIPHSDLPYTTMEDENFKICWNLNNLRPLNAKINVFEGTRRTRHNK